MTGRGGGRSHGAGHAGGRANLTGRAATLALVLCLLAISLAYPLRQYLAQRSEIAGYRTTVAAQEQRVAQLRRQQQRWADPAYVAVQARQRLRYVLPGETSYVVLGAGAAEAATGGTEVAPVQDSSRPWFTDLWRSVEGAGRAGR